MERMLGGLYKVHSQILRGALHFGFEGQWKEGRLKMT